MVSNGLSPYFSTVLTVNSTSDVPYLHGNDYLQDD